MRKIIETRKKIKINADNYRMYQYHGEKIEYHKEKLLHHINKLKYHFEHREEIREAGVDKDIKKTKFVPAQIKAEIGFEKMLVEAYSLRNKDPYDSIVIPTERENCRE